MVYIDRHLTVAWHTCVTIHFVLTQTALTPFEGLCGFRPLTEIQKYLNTVPEIAEVIGQDPANAIASGSGL